MQKQSSKMDRNFVVPQDVFEKGPQKLSLLNLSKRDNIISTTFFKNIVTTKFESQLVVVC